MQNARLSIAFAFLPLAVAQRPLGAPVRTTVCELVREPNHYNGKLVEIHARIARNEEATAIVDDNCSALILFVVGDPKIADKPGSGPAFRKLMRLLKTSPGVTALVAGKFEHSPAGRVWGHQSMFDSRLITMSVTDVRAAPAR